MTSTETKHTPGPWLMADKPSSVVGWPVVQQGTGRVICTLNYIQHTQIDPKVPSDRAFNAESRANGKLIAVAPKLLEALKGARATLARLGHDTAHLEVVIAKAEGR